MSYPPPPSGPDDASGAEQPNPYGGPPPTPATPPTYGQPPAPGQPSIAGQPPIYGQPPVPGQPPGYGASYEKPPSQALAIWALVLACIPCLITNLVSIVLAIVVLVGKKGGRLLAIIALVINAVVILGFIALISLGVVLGSTPIDDLSTGQCFTADGLNDSDTSGVSSIKVVGCSESHDAEVVGTKTLTADEATAYADQSVDEVCGPLVSPELLAALSEDVTVTALTQSSDPSSGDLLACVAHTSNGDALTEKLG